MGSSPTPLTPLLTPNLEGVEKVLKKSKALLRPKGISVVKTLLEPANRGVTNRRPQIEHIIMWVN